MCLCETMMCYGKRFIKQDAGNAVSEYAVCLAMIVLGCIVALTALGAAVSALFPELAELIP